jgi:hypothetical protein
LGCEYYVGLDLGQARNFSAIAVVMPDEAYLEAQRNQEKLLDSLGSASGHPHVDSVDLRHLEEEIEARLYHNPLPQPSYHARHLERMPLGTSYVKVVRRVLAIVGQLPGAELAVDAGGAGAAVVDLLRSEGLRFHAVTITGAGEEKREGMSHRVRKRDLVANAQVLLQQRRLKIAATLPEASTLAALLLALWAAGRETAPVDPTLVGTSGLVPGVPDADLYRLDDPHEGRF